MKLHFTARFWLTTLTSWMLLMSGVHGAEDRHEHESCACAAQADGFVIDCSNQGAMEDAEGALASNDCNTDCTTEICHRNYLLVQSHHDYCLPTEVTTTLGDTMHLYEDSCGEGCHIVAKANPSLPDCPEVSCDDDLGNDAYAALADAGCASNCTSDLCGPYYRTLLIVHDTCPSDTLDTVAEAAFHTIEEQCDPLHGCNFPQDDEDPLVCVEETSAAAGRTVVTALLGAVVLPAWVL